MMDHAGSQDIQILALLGCVPVSTNAQIVHASSQQRGCVGEGVNQNHAKKKHGKINARPDIDICGVGIC